MTNEAEEKPPTISDDLVVTKYKMAAEIDNREFKSRPRSEKSRLFPVGMRLDTRVAD